VGGDAESVDLEDEGDAFLRNSGTTQPAIQPHIPKIGISACLTLEALAVTILTTVFNTHKFYVLPTQCTSIYVSCVDLRTNSDYFTVQH
jgi:hypothetical protein